MSLFCSFTKVQPCCLSQISNLIMWCWMFHWSASTVCHAKKILGLWRTTNLAIGPIVQLSASTGGENHTRFFHQLFQKFHEQWPPASPNADEISKADGNEEKAITLKQKASKQVSGSFTIIYLVVLIQYMHATSDSMSTSITKAGDRPQGLEQGRL